MGEALAERLAREFGGEDAFLEAASRAESSRIAAVEGVGERRAADIVLAVQGLDPSAFLRTSRARSLHDDLIARIQAFASTDPARDRAALLVPLTDRAEIDRRLAFALAAKARVATLPVDELAAALRKVRAPRTPRPKFDSSVAVLVDHEEDRARLVQAGLDRHCLVACAEDGDAASADLVVYAYSSGSLDLEGTENVVTVPYSSDPAAVFPDVAVAWWRENRAVLEAAAEARRLLGEPTRIPEALALLDRDGEGGPDWPAVEAAAHAAVEAMDRDLRSRTAALGLAGDEVLDMLAGRTPRKIRDAQAEVLRAGLASLTEAVGEELHVFTDGFPAAVDEEALEAARRRWTGRRLRRRFHDRLQAARRLSELQAAAEGDVAALLEFDHVFMLGRFALAYDLHPAVFGRGWSVEGALHLALPRGKAAPVDYHLGAASGRAEDGATRSEERVALLTGANSGGKTTLLETLAQVCLLAHMGLPVPARRATVEPVESLWFFTPKRSLDAGAFESFLRSFVPIVTGEGRKLVLADEIEAMTELDAAARIVGTFLELLRTSGSCGVCVTHLAEEVSRHTSVRIDGIEARGLDERMELVVDRTPRIGYRARSTPEFILRRLEATTTGAEREVFRRLLASFDPVKGC